MKGIASRTIFLLVLNAAVSCLATDAPVITAFGPASGAVGEPVALSGINFDAAPSNNIVYFGGVRAVVTSASTTELTVKVPTGATHAAITVTVNGLTAWARAPFLPTFPATPTNFNSASLAPAFNLTTGIYPIGTILADLDGDGKPDLATANGTDHGVSVFRNQSSSGVLTVASFAPRVDFPLPAGPGSGDPYKLTAADVDGDGRQDLIVTDVYGSRVSIFRNTSTEGSITPGSFASPVSLPVGADCRFALAADLDGDGRADIIALNYGANTLSILRNIGVPGSLTTNSFAPRVDLPAPGGPYEIAVGDLDGDGKSDLALATGDVPSVSVFRNAATAGTIDTNSFDPRVDFPAPPSGASIVIGDLDGDGKLDLILVGTWQAQTLSVFRNLASPGALNSGSFAPRVDFPAGNWAFTVALGDLNGDGKVDIASVGQLPDHLSLFQNTSTPGSFSNSSLANRVDYGSGWNTAGVLIGDLDGDGRPDVAFCNTYSASLTIYKNVIPYSGPPRILGPPASQAAILGDDVTFRVIASGDAPLSYQWRIGGTNIAGATDPTLTLANVQFTNAGTYSVQVTNTAGATNSTEALLTVSPVPSCSAPTSNLIAWWRAEGNALDHTGGNPGTLTGNTGYGTGRVGQAFVFDGNHDSVQVGNPPGLQLQDFSIELWVKRASASASSTSADNALFFGYGHGGYGFGLLDNGNLFLTKVDIDNVTLGTGISDANWHHVAVTKSGTGVVFYIDGTAYPVPTYDTFYEFGTSAAIGARGDNQANGFYGSVDELAVYSRKLEAAEIQTIYATRSAGKCTVPIPPFIVRPPQGQTVIRGTNVDFTVTAGGSTPLSYQWRFNGTNIANATNATLSLINPQFTNAGKYSVLVSNAVDSVLSSDAVLTVVYPPALILIGSTNVMAGRPVTVPVILVANGNENSLGFSLNFDPSLLNYGSTTPGAGAAGATLLVNTNLIANGEVGIAVIMPSQATFSPGTQEVVRVTFNSRPVLGAESASTVIGFGDAPLLRELSDAQLQALAADYIDGTVALVPTVFESDVSPRTNGNQTLSLTDWLQVGRFVAQLDTPAVGGEFQRADCAPRGTLGDGQLKATDWVQAGRYIAGLDPFAAIGGPASESAPTIAGPSVSRQLRIGSANAFQVETAVVPVTLEAQGDENALGFTVVFDPAALTFVSATSGSGAAGANLTANTNQTGSGRLGVVLILPTGSAFTAGSKELVKISFATSSLGAFPLTLTDQLVTRCVSDVSANELPVSYFNGNVTVNTTVSQPSLAISRLNNSVVLSWPSWAGDFALQMSDGNTGLLGVWTNAPGLLQTNAGRISVVLPISSETQFFRLRR